MTVTRAALYLRISQDRDGAGLGVERQEQDCRALCKRRGWAVADAPYCDNDRSAYNGKLRPEWERLLADVREGSIDAIVSFHIDRITRSPLELEGLIAFAEQHGLELGTCSGDVDLGTATGRMVARIIGATARQESERKSERQRRERQQSAEAGKVAGGGSRAYGYEDGGRDVREDEAEIVRECAGRALAGETLHSIARDLNGRGLTTSTGRAWSPPHLRRILHSARIGGRREHLGNITGKAVWPGIISPEDSDRLRRLLDAPERGGVKVGRTYMLSGILRCGQCGAGLVGRVRAEGATRNVRRYVCDADGCRGTATVGDRADDLIRDRVIFALEGPGLRGQLAAARNVDPELSAAVTRDREKLAELDDMWERGEIDRAGRLRLRENVQARLDKAERIIAQASGPDPLSAFLASSEGMRARWDEMNTSQRRAIVVAMVERIDVAPATAKWDPRRFRPPVWRV